MANDAIKRIPNVCECGNHAWVALSRWGVTLVDPEDIGILQRWQFAQYGRRDATYARGHCGSLHRMIAGAGAGQVADHKNHNTLDNRRENLRVGTPCQNNANFRKKKAPSSSRFKGVNGMPRQNDIGWYARIKFNKKSYHLGIFDNEEDAAEAYDKAAVEFFGEFAMTNRKMGLR